MNLKCFLIKNIILDPKISIVIRNPIRINKNILTIIHPLNASISFYKNATEKSTRWFFNMDIEKESSCRA